MKNTVVRCRFIEAVENSVPVIDSQSALLISEVDELRALYFREAISEGLAEKEAEEYAEAMCR